MIEPQTAPVSPVSSNQSAIALTQAGMIVESGRFSLQTVGKTILRLHNPTILHPLSLMAVPVRAVEAMQQLTAVVTRLRSPAGGCPPELEPTPANLSPYVKEEIEEVLVALQGFLPAAATGSAIETPYLPVEDLIPRLLWQVARSSYAVMQLIEGVPAQIKLAEPDWQMGMVRLVAILEAEIDESSWAFDLVTRRPLTDLLSPATCLQFDWQAASSTFSAEIGARDLSGEAEQTIEQHLEQLQQVICTRTSGIQPLTQGLKVDLLEPGKGWQSGLLRLRFSFEFVSDWQAEIVDLQETDRPEAPQPSDSFRPGATTVENFVAQSAAIAEDRFPIPTLEEFAAEVAEANGEAHSSHRSDPIPVPMDDFLGSNTLEDFVSNLTVPSHDRGTGLPPESALPEADTLAEFAMQIAQVLSEPPEMPLSQVSEPETLEEFAVEVGQTIAPTPDLTSEGLQDISEPIITLDDVFLEVGDPDSISPIEVLPAEQAVVHPLDTDPVRSEAATAAQTIDIASVEILTAHFEQQAEPANHFFSAQAPADALYPESETTLTFRLIDADLQQTLSQAIAQQQITTRLLQYPEIVPDRRELWLLEQAWESLQVSEPAAATPIGAETHLTDWMPRLLWQISRTSYEMMRLIGGIEATVLQPHWGWRLGLLRMLAMLQITTVGDTWEIDLATGQPVPADFLSLDPRAIVRSEQLAQYQQPTLAEVVSKTMITQAQATTPEIAQWMAGCPVELRSSHGDWQPATLKLILSLEFDLGIQTINYR
jgi:hypothetical protein